MAARNLFAGLCLAILPLAALAQTGNLYWKVEGGYGVTRDADFKDKNFSPAGSVVCGSPICSTPGHIDDAGSGGLIGGGAGWRFGNGLRGDITLTYRGGMRLDGTDGAGIHDHADISSLAAFANGYWDLPWGNEKMRPFIGAGAGYARNKIDTLTLTVPVVPTGLNVSSSTTGNFAWALTAGIGWEIRPGLQLDVAYRYVDLGKFQTGQTISFPAFGLSAFYNGATGDLRLNEVTVGLRF